ncbi:DUF4391 domain-containing protein [Halomonas sp. 7T]|uniref:DUF4391 domain-containing protein n=1 Tax=Halomonas sp. 7T TaxID=2893469 RepID=UPI0021D7D781|nr:DUF4391 domain-containing protein [Halomonas sp. 7T]UXZ55634.1 DUF4391 domain-containing protein [Halomonas sp. 7T]
MFYHYPDKTRLDRVVAKQKVLAHTKGSNKLRERFRDEVEQITWHAKIAPSTLNLPGTKDVPELQVFVVTLKGEALHDDVLSAIDHAIPFPIVFELKGPSGVCVKAAYKRPSQADANKWVTDESYLSSGWHAENTERHPLPPAIHLQALYHQWLSKLIPTPKRDGERLEEQLSRFSAASTLEKQAEKLEKRLRNTKQFNRKVELNAELRGIREKIADYIAR